MYSRNIPLYAISLCVLVGVLRNYMLLGVQDLAVLVSTLERPEWQVLLC